MRAQFPSPKTRCNDAITGDPPAYRTRMTAKKFAMDLQPGDVFVFVDSEGEASLDTVQSVERVGNNVKIWATYSFRKDDEGGMHYTWDIWKSVAVV